MKKVAYITLGMLIAVCAVVTTIDAREGTGRVEYLKATENFNKCWKEENPRLAYKYLSEAARYAQTALTFQPDQEIASRMNEIIRVSNEYDVSKLEATFVRAVQNKILLKWMTADEVKACFGRPDKVNRAPFSRKEEWVYKDKRVLRFMDGYLLQIQLPGGGIE